MRSVILCIWWIKDGLCQYKTHIQIQSFLWQICLQPVESSHQIEPYKFPELAEDFDFVKLLLWPNLEVQQDHVFHAYV